MQQDPRQHSIIAGMMRLAGIGEEGAMSFLDFLLESGVCWFDHADIYGGGSCEEIFGRWLASRRVPREKLIIQSKCGIVPGVCYNASREHIVSSTEGILRRLGCGYLDYLLIHRPDILWEADEIAAALDQLTSQGKIRGFGVSNCNPAQMEYLRRSLGMKPEINQIQLSLAFAPSVSESLETNTYSPNGVSRSMGIIDYCRMEKVVIQAWSPLQHGTFAGTFLDSPAYGPLNDRLREIAARHQVPKAAVAAAWLTRIPPATQVICGSCSREHFSEMLAGRNLLLSREEWYALYMSAGYALP